MNQGKLFVPSIDCMPKACQAYSARVWHDIAHAQPELGEKIEHNAALRAQMYHVFAVSHYVADACTRCPTYLLDHDDVCMAPNGKLLHSTIARELDQVSDMNDVMRYLRLQREREMIRLIWREACQLDDIQTTLKYLTQFADCVIKNTYDWLMKQKKAQWGTPCDRHGTPVSMIVIALGKLGGCELNASSDIDLMFAYSADGKTQGGKQCIDNYQFFTELAQDFIKILSSLTTDGFVFRVDMRLRPFGSSGPLLMSFTALENYYQEQGRNWERYALIKSRLITGSAKEKKALSDLLIPFVFRRYIDYSVLNALRDMKQSIADNVRKIDIQEDIKLGPGGIREIEFIAQSYQLIRGGKEKNLQGNNLLTMLGELADRSILTKENSASLSAAYLFLRRTEHYLQVMDDQQTQLLPNMQAQKDCLAYAMRCKNWDAFADALQAHRQEVGIIFSHLLVVPYPQGTDSAVPPQLMRLRNLWSYVDKETDQLMDGEHFPFENNERVIQLLRDFKQSAKCQNMSALARKRLTHLMPLLLFRLAQYRDQEIILIRLLDVMQAILRRSSYLVLLAENDQALKHFIEFCAASPWFSEQLSRYPLLFDELLDPRLLFLQPSREEITAQLDRLLAQVADDDVEKQMQVLREFKLSTMLHIAANDVIQSCSLLHVSDQLTVLAEVIVERVLYLSWRQIRARYQPFLHTTAMSALPFCIVAYGKLAGAELGYTSDLDLIFLYEPFSNAEQGMPSANDVFLRLAQRIVHSLDSRMTTGVLYHSDTRLRPTGDAGMLVVSMNYFIEYQEKKAWLWEHQALVRSRFICGPDHLRKKFLALRRRVLQKKRDPAAVLKAICEMREKMRAHSKKHLDSIDLKQDPGGIIDIEFIAQCYVLCYSQHYPSLLEYPDTIRILETIAQEKLLDEACVMRLVKAYTTFRQHIHRLDLQNKPPLVPLQFDARFREQVQAVWVQLMQAAAP